jgi:hypothetical protein
MQAPGKLPPAVGAQCGCCAGIVRTASWRASLTSAWPILWPGNIRCSGILKAELSHKHEISPPLFVIVSRAQLRIVSCWPAVHQCASRRQHETITTIISFKYSLLANYSQQEPRRIPPSRMTACPRPGSSAEANRLGKEMGRGQTCS